METLSYPCNLYAYKEVMIYQYALSETVHMLVPTEELLNPIEVKITWIDKVFRIKMEYKIQKALKRLYILIDDYIIDKAYKQLITANEVNS